jgi:beta-lactamase regulating signal transducer with metallopeptidase domain
MSEWALSWLSHEELVAVGWTLLHFCWQGAAIAILFALTDRLSSRASQTVRYVVALAAFALMPLTVIVTFANEMQVIAPVRSAGAMPGKAENLIGVAPRDSEERQTSLPAMPSAASRQNWLAVRAEQALPWIDGLWALGMLVLATRALGGWWQLKQLRRRASGIVPSDLERAFHRISEHLKVGRQAALRISDEVISPLAMGLWQATVILPLSSVLNLSAEELEAVLAHELGHIRRWDYVCNLLQTAVESVLFFHPAMWWLSEIVRDRREACCDEIAVRNCVDAVVYARALLRLEEQRKTEFRLAMALGGCSGSLLGRVNRVLGEDGRMESKMTNGVRAAVAGAVVLGLLLVPKMSDAVAVPLLAATRPIVAQVAGVGPKASVAIEPKDLKPATSDVKPQVKVNTDTVVQFRPESVQEASVNTSADGLDFSFNTQADEKPATATKAGSKGGAYIDEMRAAGYPLDLNKDLDTLISLKALGVTPEYAKQMANVGFGKPTLHELISLKSLGVTPEYLDGMRKSGLAPKDLHEAVSEKALGITPEYATQMKESGFAGLDVQRLISLKAQGVTPEYVKWIKQQWPNVTTDELQRAAVFHLDDKFVAEAKAHGFDGKDLDKLLRLKMSGLLD